MYMWPIPNDFRDTAISLYSSKIVDTKEILRAVSNTGIYCSSDNVGKVDIDTLKYVDNTRNGLIASTSYAVCMHSQISF
jgi:predicted transport protein